MHVTKFDGLTWPDPYADDFCRKKMNSVKAIVTSGHPHYVNLNKIDVYRNFVEK